MNSPGRQAVDGRRVSRPGAAGEGRRRPAADRSALPVLWHLKVSSYNEKARWALDYKGVPHVRRAVLPRRHPAIAKRLTGGTTFPVLELDGEAIGDSTAIIAALEERHPEPPLYPSDPVERRRALELEDFFDEELGPYARRSVVSRMLPDAGLFLGAFAPDLPRGRRMIARATFPLVRRRVRSDLSINEVTVEHAERKLREVGERFRAELQLSGYLVGNAFTVADLTLASLVAPLVAPQQFPYPQPQRGHPLVEPLRDLLAESGILEWTRGIYALHRGHSAEVAAR
jgi:glutathione S-transferase